MYVQNLDRRSPASHVVGPMQPPKIVIVSEIGAYPSAPGLYAYAVTSSTVIASCSPSLTGIPRSSSLTYPTAETLPLLGALGERSPGRKSRLHAASISIMPAPQL